MPAETASERFLREQNLISTENKSMETQLRMLQKGGALTKAIAKTGGFLFGGGYSSKWARYSRCS